MATGVYKETFNVNKIAQTAQIFEISLSERVESTRNGKVWRLSGRFQTLIWRPGDAVQNLESPEFSGRVDNTALDLNTQKIHN